ncbi:MAG TPA: hypothetical protein VNV44_07885 [Solirubrobacteraceae bacterium]|jgi:hypothetical protein|nr:hypothetical protein [Solirubrobacteraceae bacterium]
MTAVGKAELQAWVVEAIEVWGGSAALIDVCRVIWRDHETDLRDSGDLFYTWQYDVRWAATGLRKRGLLHAADVSPRGLWELT